MAEVSAAWLNLMSFVEAEIPHGVITLTIVDSRPFKLVSAKREIRFDKGSYFPEPGVVKGKGLEIKTEA